MLKYIVKRCVNYVIMLFVSVSLTYFLASMTLRPRTMYMQRHPHPPIATINRSLTNANINDQTSVFVRYGRWLKGIVTQWNWGLSPDQAPVNRDIATRIAPSLELLTLSTILAIVIGVSIGVYTAIHQYQWQDRTFSMVATVLLCIPNVVLYLLVIIAAIWINDKAGNRIFYVTGLHSYSGGNPIMWLLDLLQHIALPTFAMTVSGAVGYHLNQRTYLLDTINDDYVRTARAKGLTKGQAIRRHALRTSLIPTAVSVAYSISGVFTGAVLGESIFGIDGLGHYTIATINANDINGVVAISAFTGAFTMVGMLLADLFSAWLDPRIRLE